MNRRDFVRSVTCLGLSLGLPKAAALAGRDVDTVAATAAIHPMEIWVEPDGAGRLIVTHIGRAWTDNGDGTLSATMGLEHDDWRPG